MPHSKIVDTNFIRSFFDDIRRAVVTDKQITKQTMIYYAIPCALLFSLFILSFFVGVESDLFFKENGVIESASVLGYFICAAFIVCKRKIVHLRHIFLLIIFLMLRELDFHKRFTTMGIFKIRFFTSNNVPLMEKMIGILVILLLIYIAGSIFYRHSKNFTAGLKKRSTVSIGVLLAFAFMGLSKALDGLARKLDGVGIEVSKQISMHAGALEEILEFGIPIIILFTLSAYFKDAEG